MNTFLESPFVSFTSPGESRLQETTFPSATPSAKKPTDFSPWVQSTRQIMALPFYEGDPSPSRETRIFACYLVEHSYRLSQKFQLDWEKPLVNSTDESEIILEWWRGANKLTLYIKDFHATSIRVWGDDIFSQMDEGSFGTQFVSPLTFLWLWLHR